MKRSLLAMLAVTTATDAFTALSTHRLPQHFLTQTSSLFASSLVDREPSFLEPDDDSSEQVSAASLPSAAATNDMLVTNESRPNMDAIINTVVLLGIAGAILFQLASPPAMQRGWTPEEVAAHIPTDIWTSYTTTLANRPIETKAITSASVYTIGDVIAQKTEGKTIGELDRLRTLRNALAGLIGHGPMSHVWYNVCDNFFENVVHLHSWWSFLPKVVTDQTVFGPVWNNTYLLLLGLMKLEPLGDIWDNMKRSTVPLIVSGLKLWPLAHCVTYGLIPVENRLLWVDFVEIFWVTILATQASRPSKDAKTAELEAAVPK